MKKKKKERVVAKGVLKRLFSYIRPNMSLLLVSVSLTLGLSLLTPFRPYLIKIATDDYISVGDQQGLLYFIVVFFGSVLLLQFVIQLGATYTAELMGNRAIRILRMDVFTHLQKLSLRFFDKNPIGRLITRATSDVESLNDMLSAGVVHLIGSIVQIVFMSCLMAWIDWRLTLVVFSILPFMFYATLVFKGKIQVTYQAVRQEVARINVFLQEHITGVATIKAFGREQPEFEKHKEINAAHRDANIRTIFYHSIFYPAIEFLSATALGLIIFYSVGAVSFEQITLGTILSFIQYISLFFHPIQELSDKYNILQNAITSADRIFSLLDEKDIIHDPIKKTSIDHNRDGIVFSNVSFSYNQEKKVLDKISFRVKDGESVALVGATGSGKSTIISLLCKFYSNYEGSITINGIDSRNLSKHDIRSHIGIVLQDVFLFSGTVRDNITMHDSKITDQEIVRAAKYIGIHNMIESLPGGYDFQIRERGSGLSVGQRQLLAFLRVMVYKPKVLALDEATSSVDSVIEKKIEHALEKMMRDMTIITVAHRLSTIRRANKIIVLHKGTIKEMGTHHQLMVKKGLYSRLYHLQYSNETVQRTTTLYEQIKQ